jgi:hypothetical protein
MEHIGRKEIFVVLFLFLLGVPVSENGNNQEKKTK